MNKLKSVTVELKYRTTQGMSSQAGYSSNAPGVTAPREPRAVLADVAGECARLAAIDGDDEIVLAEVKAALQRVREWRREHMGWHP